MARKSESAGKGKPTNRPDSAAKATDRKSLGKYTIRKKIGAGGMGTVYLATDTELNRTVALKVLPRQKATNNPTLIKRFKAEARAAAQLTHDNIVKVYEAGQADGLLFIALEYVAGTDVQAVLDRRGPLSVTRSTEIVKQVARALLHVHKRGIVHRDIKPSNLLIRKDGGVKVTDLGLARTIDSGSQAGLTQAGTTVGTVDYMAPEQARDSQAADIRSDIYSLGCSWYHMLTGTPPFPEGSLTNKLNAHATQPLPDPRRFNESIPEGVVAVMQRMVAKSPDDRYQTPGQLLKDLESETLTRGSLSDDALAALAEEADVVSKSSASKPSPRPTARGLRTPTTADAPPTSRRPQPDRTLPPPAPRPRTQPTSKPAVSKQAVSNEPVSNEPVTGDKPQPGSGRSGNQNAVIIAGVIAMLGLLWWISTQFADDPQIHTPGSQTYSTVESPNQPLPPQQNRDESPNEPGDPDGDSVAESENGEEPATPDADSTIAALGRKGEQSHIPAWAAGVAALGKKAASAIDIGLPVITVGPGGTSSSHFSSLRNAILSLPQSGGVVQLVGDGPFLLRPVRIANREQVVITAQQGHHPLVVLQPEYGEQSGVVVAASQSSLVFNGLHLLALAEQFPSDDGLKLVEVDSGDLAVLDCSVTLVGRREGSTSAFRLSGTASRNSQNQPRILFNNSFIRGNNLTAIDIDQTATDLVAINSVFATGTAASVRLGNSLRPVSVTRDLRFLSCTFCANREAFVLRPGADKEHPPTTQIHALNSLFGAPEGSKSVLVSLGNWPLLKARGSNGSMLHNLRWRADSSLFLGWGHLVWGESTSFPRVQEGADWQLLWQKDVRHEQFHFGGWPETRISSFSRLVPQRLDASDIGIVGVKATDGGDPGCDVAKLSVPTSEMLARAVATINRPELPMSFTAPATNRPPSGNTVNIDASSSDLGKVISKTDWPSGTLFVVSGSGNRKSSPIRVQGKSLRIQFETDKTGSALLTVIPRPVVKTSADSAALVNNAFISVTGGTIEIINGNFKFERSTRQTMPSWFLHVTDGSFSLRSTTVQGPLLDCNGYKGLVRWTRESSSGSNAGRFEHYGHIADSFLVGYGKLLKADLRNRALVLQNSILVSLNDLFDLNIMGSDPRIGGAVQIERCTLSASDTFFHLRTAALTKPPTLPLSFFVDETVFAPPVSTRTQENPRPTLLTYTGASQERRQIDWWGTKNGYAVEISRFLQSRQDSASPAPQSFASGWLRVWGPIHIVDPLTGPEGVELTETLSRPKKITPKDFALQAGSRAMHWANDGRTIGAVVGTNRSSGNASSSSDTDSTNQKPGTGSKRPTL